RLNLRVGARGALDAGLLDLVLKPHDVLGRSVVRRLSRTGFTLTPGRSARCIPFGLLAGLSLLLGLLVLGSSFLGPTFCLFLLTQFIGAEFVLDFQFLGFASTQVRR